MRCLGELGAILGDQEAGDAVIGPSAGEIGLDDGDAIGLPRRDCGVQLLDRRLFEAKRLVLGAGLFCHRVSPT